MTTSTPDVPAKKRLLIMGFAPDSRGMLANYVEDPHTEIWGINELYEEEDMKALLLPARADRWFQLHGYEPPTVRDPKQKEHLAMLKCPIVMWKEHPEIPNSIPYPLDEIVRHFDIFGEGMAPEIAYPEDRVYFTNTISLLLALGIYEGFEEIHLAGVNMAQNNGPLGSEYSFQRPSCEFFLGWARGAGIKIYLPPQSDLLMSYYIYGLDQGRRFVVKYEKRIEELQGRVNELRNQRLNLQNQAQQALNGEHSLLGALEDAQYLYHLSPGNVRGEQPEPEE